MSENNINEKWLKQRIGTAYAYWESRVSANELREKCIEGAIDAIRRYREGVDPEPYRETIERLVDHHLQRDWENI